MVGETGFSAIFHYNIMPEEEINFEKIRLKKYFCECGARLCDYYMIEGKTIIEIKCYSCNKFNAIYLEKEKIY